MEITNKENPVVIFKQKDVVYNSKEYNKQYQINLSYWGQLRNNEIEINAESIEEMIKSKCDFWIRLINDKPYNLPNMVMVCLSFNYIGTNAFDGYISADYFNQLKSVADMKESMKKEKIIA